jgi:hypothetical protein
MIFVFLTVKSKLTPEIWRYVEDVAKLPKSAIGVVDVGITMMPA